MRSAARATYAGSFASPAEMLRELERLTAPLGPSECVRNFVGVVEDMGEDKLAVETELFPRDALEFYTHHNLGEAAPPDADGRMAALAERFYTPERGGGQGDYRAGMKAKVDNVVDCLAGFPGSKRAVLAVAFSGGKDSAEVRHDQTDEAKCLREIHFYVDEADGRVHATGFMRAQAASIFPKNVHFIGSLMREVASRLGRGVGSYTHMVTSLVGER